MAQKNVKQSHPTLGREREAAGARAELLRSAKEQGIKPATTFEELLGPDTGQSQEEIRAEVNDFLNLLREWRNEPPPRDLE